ncbi:hypothetical protein D3C80_1371580 [compost metagenome]
MPLVVFHAHHQVIAGDAGIVDQDGRRTEQLLDLGQGCGDRLIAAYVQLQASAFDAVLLEGCSDVRRPRGRGGGTHDNGAHAPQFQRNGLANAAARAGNQCNFTLQAHASSPKSGQRCASGSESIRGIEVVGGNAIGAALVQPCKHLARATLDQ